MGSRLLLLTVAITLALCAVARADALPAPADFKGSPGDGVAKLSWSPVLGAAGYEVLDASDKVVASPDAAATGADIAGTNGVPATYRVRAVDFSAAPGDLSPQVEVTPNGPLPAPTLEGSPGDGVAKLSWTAVTGADHYTVTTVGGGTQSVDGTTTSLEVKGVNGTPAKYTVKAVDTANHGGADSNEVEVTPTGPLPAPTLKGDPGDG